MSEQPPDVDAADIDQTTIDQYAAALIDVDVVDYPDGLDVTDRGDNAGEGDTE